MRKNGIETGKILVLFIVVYCLSLCIFAFNILRNNTALWSEGVSGDTLGKLSVAAVYPVVDVDLGKDQKALEGDNENITAKAAQKPQRKEKQTKKAQALPNDKNPQVLIVHTHATESYLPAKAGNYHTTKSENTVRDVGDVMMKYLQKNGISVYHDRTLHDNPSYNDSYNRSYETIEKIVKANPSIICVIDLHRDAIPSSVEARTVNVNGNACSAYSYVVGEGAANADINKAFIRKLNQRASNKFGGFVGEVMTRGYIYNQNLCDNSILLEVGNNRNTIGESRNTARYLAEVLADVLKDI